MNFVFALTGPRDKLLSMRYLFTVILLAQFSFLHAQENDLTQDAITKPAMSLRCKELLKERAEKIGIQQRLNGLLQRNQDLIRKSPKARPSVHNRLLSSQVKVKNELYLTNLNIETMEENIVRSGCPGLAL